MKNRVVMFCTMPLVATSQKSTCFDPSGHLKNGKCIFLCGNLKNTCCKSCLECKDAHIHQNGTMVPMFAVELAQTMVIYQGTPRELLLGSTSL
jgi:hypothetical protein